MIQLLAVSSDPQLLESILPRVLQILGIGFLFANLRLAFDFIRYFRMRSSALLTWPGRRPPYYGLGLAMAVVLGTLVFVKLVRQQRPLADVFGESMMFLYYGYLLPLSVRIGRGFYREGIWSERGFLPYSKIGGMAWREDQDLTLMLILRMRPLAKPLLVPRAYYGQVRRLLRDKIAEHAIHFTGKAFDLGVHDERDDV